MTNAQISGCVISNCQEGIRFGEPGKNNAGPTGVGVHNCSINGSTLKGIRNETQSITDATCNYWGSPSGPTHATNPGGSGDKVSSNVTFYPWLGEYPSQVCGLAKYEKSLAIDALSLYQTIPPAPNKDLRDDVKEAIKKINESLGAGFWAVAPNRLTAQGTKMFDKEKDAVKRLRDEIVNKYSTKGPITSALRDAALDAIKHLVMADNILASVAIADAVVLAPLSRYLTVANDKFAKAMAEYANGRYPEAIDRYKEAWQNAMNALKNAGITVEESPVPTESGLSPNYPNPFNPSTTFRYQLSTAATVSLKIYNTLGQEVAVLVNEQKEPGYHQVTWNASNVPSGIYFCRLQTGKLVATQKIILMK